MDIVVAKATVYSFGPDLGPVRWLLTPLATFLNRSIVVLKGAVKGGRGRFRFCGGGLA